MNYWLVSANWEASGDQTQRFIEDGIWQNRYDIKYTDIVNKMRPKDKIAIKITYTNEDFIQGFRPNEEGKFELKGGIFYNLVKEARKEYENAEKENRKFSFITLKPAFENKKIRKLSYL